MTFFRCYYLFICLLAVPAWLSAQEEESAKPEVQTHFDYATPLDRLHDSIMATDLFHDRSRYRSQLDRYLDQVKNRYKAEEADEKLARRAYLLAKQMVGVIDEWDEKQEDLERIRNDAGLIKTSDENKAKQELEERIARKSGNLASRWDSELEGRRFGTERELATIKEWQGRLDRAIDAGIVKVLDRPLPKPAAPATPQPIPEEPPEPVVQHTFTMPKTANRMGDDVKTPEHLIEPVTKTAGWLEMQQRRAGGKLASKISGTQDGRVVTLNLQVTDLYKAQTKDTKRRFAETLQQFWATTCSSAGRIADQRLAHVLLFDSHGELVAISADADGSVIKVMN